MRRRMASTSVENTEMFEIAITSEEEKEMLFTSEEKNKMFEIAMKGEWREMVNIYKNKPGAHKAQITRSGDTALHIAISDGQEKIVAELVALICVADEQRKESLITIEYEQGNALTIENEQGNTPLHVAASMGNVKVCDCIARVNPELVGARNKLGETPIFLAALHGKKDAFLYLDTICGTGKNYSYCRRKDGETILHRAIARDYFDLAYQIILRYKDLVNYVNEEGISPLHLLASKPFAFRSGNHLSLLDNIIYHCIFVDELKAELFHPQPLPKSTSEDEKNPKYPENYQACINFFGLLQKAIGVVTFRRNALKGQADAKNIGAEHQGNSGQEIVVLEVAENPRAEHQGHQSTDKTQGHQLFPSNYKTYFDFIKLIYRAILVILGLGFTVIKKVRDKKEKNIWSLQIMNELLEYTSMNKYEDNAKNPNLSHAYEDDDTRKQHGEGLSPPLKQHGEGEGKNPKSAKTETPILIAAKNGVTEIVEKILELFPVAIHDMNSDKKNIVLLAAENRQHHVYKLLLNMGKISKESVFRKVDNKGNSALHLAATLGAYWPWLVSGATLQMKWEVRWCEFVKNSIHPDFFTRYNNEGQTAEDVFREKHKELAKQGSEWLTKTSEICSVAATVVTTVAFATSATVPGGLEQKTGAPTFLGQPAFFVFAFSSLAALCFSVIFLFTFLSVYTSQHQKDDCNSSHLPTKFLVALTSLLISVVSMLISFFSSHFLVLKDKLKLNASSLYAVSCLVVTLIVVSQFPWYFDFIRPAFPGVHPPCSRKDKAKRFCQNPSKRSRGSCRF